ncbi:MAG TPA: histone deacetylase [Candidatus Eisenbacteria bacterium]|nr:histone deacetylase [Candidatus Eisenbacteria bacterium]
MTSRPLYAWTSHAFTVPLPAHHRLPIAKYAVLVERLITDGVLDLAHVHASRLAPREWLEAAHDQDYVERVFEGRFDDAEIRRLGIPWSPQLVARARAAVFGTVSAARAALVHGVAGNLAGGSHHAFRDRGEAFCLFNDLAVAIVTLRAEGRLRRPFVLDLDVHQGNGTAAIFAGDPSVFTFSIHGESNYPSRKMAGSLDLGLRNGTGDEAYLEALERHLPAALDHHEPDFVFYQAGVDALTEDALGQLALTRAGLRARDARVFACCETRALPVAITLGGGYSRPHDASIEAHLGVWREARTARRKRPAVAAVDDPVDAVHMRAEPLTRNTSPS